jgi:hypothetical protein
MYVIFDVDHTLIDSYSLFYFLGTLKPEETIKLSPIDLPPCDPADWSHFKGTLADAYTYFVEDIARIETSDRPLGIFRPGILSLMTRLSDLQQRNIIDGVHLYSNNSYLPTLQFIKDLVHHMIGSSTLIQELIHWMHPLRIKERIERLPNVYIGKSWDTMYEIFRIHSSEIYYVDDLPHTELMEVLGDRYCHVPKYEFRASFDRLFVIYLRVVERARVPLYQLLQTSQFLFSKSMDDFQFDYRLSAQDNLYDFFKDKTGNTVSQSVIPQMDDGIQMMNELVDRLENEIRSSCNEWRSYELEDGYIVRIRRSKAGSLIL